MAAFHRRPTHPVTVGSATIGGDAPVVIQTMTNTSTLDTAASVAQITRCAAAGATVVRLTAQGVAHSRNLAEIRRELDRRGVKVNLVADIHFNPAAAFEAAPHVEKVRINPGNFVDPGRTFRKIDYTDAEYALELQRLEDAFVPFLDLCTQHRTAIRIGVNHGSLSDRIMSRYGDTPAGMVESAMEYLRVAVKHGFSNIVISIKASNVTVMTATVRLLVKAMEAEGMDFPLHLGVTEAGAGEDGRVKSAVGIGSLLASGIGDTIRVSLSEEPEAEIPVAASILRHIDRLAAGQNYLTVYTAEGTVAPAVMELPYVVGYDTESPVAGTKVVRASYPADMDPDDVTVAAAVDLGSLLLEPDNGIQGIVMDAPSLSPEKRTSLALAILQATRRRTTRTEYIACPGCGRTMFDLQGTLAAVTAATSHLKGLKIGVMGCIVNGPGEMADADYGYVGGAKDRISLFRGKECVEKNIPQQQAIERLIELIKADGRWIDP